jgi:hypothetical protein
MQVLVGALGEYVDGIKANDIDVSLLSGTVELHNLVVRPEVCRCPQSLRKFVLMLGTPHTPTALRFV